MKTVKKFAPYSATEIIYIESYLEDMSTKGLYLTKWGGSFAHFEHGEPRKIRYRIVPKNIDENEKEFYEEAGWQFICRKGINGEFSVFCSDNDAIPELFTDMGSYRNYMKKFRNSCITDIVLIPFVIFSFLRMMLDDYYVTGEPLIAGSGPIPYMMGLVIVLWWLATLFWNVRVIVQINRCKEIVRKTSYKRTLGIHRLLFCAFYVMFIITIIWAIRSYDPQIMNLMPFIYS